MTSINVKYTIEYTIYFRISRKESDSTKQIPGISFVFHIVQMVIIAVGYDSQVLQL